MISFDVFAVAPQGYEVHFQVQGEKVYADAQKLLSQMQADGFLPRVKPKSGDGHNNNGACHYCEEHQTEFKRFEKDGRVWYSHKAPDGKWCREK